ncbi:NAD(P)-dependent oxidoreductase [Actinoplanes sp. NPDC051411]|uniref:NAD(P)-dependent oxidoreductase n=1 Tax=Actinoplanes sp. NPDC051411 TaxID=3155522 RepID=UPI00343153B8
MTTIAFIGLGVMGAPMARNVLAAGYGVVAYNRSPGKVEAFVADGGRGAASIAEAVTGADAVVTMLPDTDDVAEVVREILLHAAPGTLIIDMSTIRPDVTRQLAAECGRFVDAPVSGGEQGAIDGTLSVMAGGSAEDFAAANPILEAVGRTIVHVGPVGSGQTVKAANQLIVAGTIELVAEALTFLDVSGVSLTPAVEVLAGGLAGSAVLDRKAPAMLARSFEPGFRADLHHKDLGIFTSSARELGVAAPVGTLVATLMAALRAQGRGSLDHAALVLLVEQLSGRTR